SFEGTSEMARVITKELALAIAKKLSAVIKSKKGRPHDLCTISHEGIIIARFGIRRGSEKDKGHDYIPGQIHISPRQAKELAICNYSKEWWIQEMRNKGLIADAGA